jgi:anti-sigma regulatory factor (Ser/Thr protein kinase)
VMYRTEDDLVSVLRPLVLEGLEAGEAVFAAGVPRNVEALRSAIGAVSSGVHFADVRDWYVKPARTLGAYLSFIHEQLEQGHPAVRIIGEVVWPDHDDDLQRAWSHYESALNGALGDLPVRVTCTYDTEHLSPSRIEAARVTHPSLIEHGREWANDRYVPPQWMMADLRARLSLPPDHEERRFDPSDVVAPAAFVIEQARRAGLSEDDRSNAAAGVSEIVMNAATRASGPLLLATWTDDQGFICQIEDEDPTPLDPFAGFGPPLSEVPADWGLWLARHLSDLLEIGVGSRGTAVRLTMRLPT